MSDTSPNPPPSEPDPSASTEATLAALGKRLAAIDRERQRIRPEDWQTLFRQMRTLLDQLATHPFLRGDAEAELRLKRMMRAADMDEFDRRVDHLAAYVAGKLAYNAAIRGKEVDPSVLHPGSTPQARATGMAARASAQHGPSGDDFLIQPDAAPDTQGGEDQPDPPRPRRSVLRL